MLHQQKLRAANGIFDGDLYQIGAQSCPSYMQVKLHIRLLLSITLTISKSLPSEAFSKGRLFSYST